VLKRVLLTTLLGSSVILATAAFWVSQQAGKVDIPVPEVQAIVFDPYSDPLLSGYKLYRDAFAAGDWVTLENLAMMRDDYVAYRSALTLAQQPDFPPLQLLGYYRRLLELRITDPLDRVEGPTLLVNYASVAESAGSYDEALRAYQEALPLPEAVEGIKRLQTDPYKLANTFLQARRYRNALEALGGRSAPSVEAPAYLNTGEYNAALDAFERWLIEVPSSPEALRGKAWALFYLDRNEEAEALFTSVLAANPGNANALYGLGLLARRAGNIDAAVTYLQQTGDSDDLWLATGYLEATERYADAIAVYMQLAKSDSGLADDGAYRAYVLATRTGDTAAAEAAKALLPANSFFAFKLGASVSLSSSTQLETVAVPALEVSNLLAQVGDQDAAIGELLFAVRRSSNPSEKVSLAEHLQDLGEYRQSWRVAEELRAQGFNDARLWQLSYPRAYSAEVVSEAARQNLEPALVWAIMRQESAFYSQARSTSNAQGLMQVIPSTWDWLAELQKEAPGNPYDPATNIRYGAFYLRWLLDYLGEDSELVIASYNRGQGYIKRLFESEYVAQNKDELYREIDALETREYLQRVMLNYQIYKELYKN
jgi:soluble lytic murein transglycosylase-like protein